MKIKISTLLLILIIIGIIILGINFLLKPKMIAEKSLNETADEEIKSELNAKIEKDFEKKIDMYLSDIYLGINTYISEFKDINSANEQWIWECVCRFLWKDDTILPSNIISKEYIETAAQKCFGDNLQKEFPKDGIEFWLEPENDGYILAAASTEADFHNSYEILSYTKNDKNIVVNIVEYKYNELFLGNPTEFSLYKINSDEVIKSYSLDTNTSFDDYNDFLSSKHNEAEKFVKENSQLFSKATITLEYDEQNDLLYIKSFKRQ